jgi:hypothetical protein
VRPRLSTLGVATVHTKLMECPVAITSIILVLKWQFHSFTTFFPCISNAGRSMAKPFNCHSLTAEAWVLSQASPCRICDAQCGTGEFFSIVAVSRVIVFPNSSYQCISLKSCNLSNWQRHSMKCLRWTYLMKYSHHCGDNFPFQKYVISTMYSSYIFIFLPNNIFKIYYPLLFHLYLNTNLAPERVFENLFPLR